MSDKALFDAVRVIKGAGLTPADVDLINRALGRTVAQAIRSGFSLSKRGADLIHSFEQCRLTAYPDPGSRDGTPWTIGWGSTGPGITRGTVWTQQQADTRFLQDVGAREVLLNTLLQGRPTTQNQFDALLSFGYNVGMDVDDDTIAEGLGDSTLLRKHLAGDFAAAKAEFAKWNKNDGKVMAGLTRRRAEEAALYGAA